MARACYNDAAAWDRTFKDDVTGAVDWFGERSEDRTRHSLVTEARGGGYDPARQQGPRQEPAAPLNDSVTQQTTAVDQIRAGPASRPQTYENITFYIRVYETEWAERRQGRTRRYRTLRFNKQIMQFRLF